MDIVKYIITFVLGFLTILIGDFLWLGFVVKSFTIREFGELIVVENGSIKLNLTAGILAWAVIVLLLLIFVVRPSQSLGEVAFYGAIFGGLLYAMYDLTNLTFLKNYSLSFTLVDIAWGIFLCTIVSISMFYGRILVSKFL